MNAIASTTETNATIAVVRVDLIATDRLAIVAACLAAVRSAIRRAGLTPDEVSMLAAYLYDREPQASIAARLATSQQTASNRVRSAVRRLEAAGGFTVPMPRRRSSRPAWQHGGRLRVRPVDPARLKHWSLTRPSGGGVVLARRNGAGMRRDDGRDGLAWCQGDGGRDF